MAELNKDLKKRFNEEKNAYVVDGTSAVEANPVPQRSVQPQRQQQQKKKQQEQQQLVRLPSIPGKIKAQIMITIVVICGLALALAGNHAKIVDYTVENNNIQRSIDNLNSEIKMLENQADTHVVLEDVENIIREKELIKPSESNIIKINP